MTLDFLTKGIGIPRRKLFAITILNAGTLSWYMLISHNNFGNMFHNFSNQSSWIWIGTALFYFFAAFSAIVGVIFSRRISGMKLLWAWTVFGVITTGMVLFFKGEAFILIFGPLLGISLGLGFPYSLSLIANCTKSEQRGRVSGILIFETFFMLILVGGIVTELNLDATGTVAALIVLRSMSFLALATYKTSACNKPLDETTSVSRINTREINRTFLMYFIPWILFIVAIVLTENIIWPTLRQNTDISLLLDKDPFHYVGTAIFALVSGSIADRFGRKIPTVIGLTLLGSGLILIGTFVSPESVFIHLMAIGIAFGFLMVIYTTIPGDLSETNNVEKFYALIVVLPLTIYGGLGALPSIWGANATANFLSPFLAFIMFASSVPVLLAKETLKEDKIAERRMKEHIEKVYKLVQESEEKPQKK